MPAKLAQLEKRAFQGIPEAQHDMATLYASGKLVAQNYPRAIHWFTKSADGGVANASLAGAGLADIDLFPDQNVRPAGFVKANGMRHSVAPLI